MTMVVGTGRKSPTRAAALQLAIRSEWEHASHLGRNSAEVECVAKEAPLTNYRKSREQR